MVGASGVAGSLPMDSHSLAEPTAEGREWETVVQDCVRACVHACVCLRERGGGLIDSRSDWGTVKRRPQSDLP